MSFEKVPVTIITGFLGAGKITLVRHLMQNPQGRSDNPQGVRIAEVECLSNCNRGCSAALTGPGRWSYIYGDLSEASVDDLLTGAARYAATSDGLVPWRERPTIFRKGVIARIPPFAAMVRE